MKKLVIMAFGLALLITGLMIAFFATNTTATEAPSNEGVASQDETFDDAHTESESEEDLEDADIG
ncbi:MAG: hypothetical protein IJV62_00540, partial [Eggerthellaceae bacterium]|nr:hypothetical protein [Eggerthellaceae bacterium]